MSGDLPEYYFRIRENGALVFRVASEGRAGRIEMEPIAFANLRSGEIRPQGDRSITEDEVFRIRAWMKARAEVQARRDADEIYRAVEQINLTAHWAQAKASNEELEAVTDALLMAMHDLRSVLVRKKAERLDRAAGEGG